MVFPCILSSCQRGMISQVTYYLESKKKKLLFWEKSMEKVLSYGSKNLYKPWNKRHLRKAMVGNKDQQYYFSILGANLSNWKIQQCRFHWT